MKLLETIDHWTNRRKKIQEEIPRLIEETINSELVKEGERLDTCIQFTIKNQVQVKQVTAKLNEVNMSINTLTNKVE